MFALFDKYKIWRIFNKRFQQWAEMIISQIEIKRVAVIGAGNQGPKIAYRCIVSGLEIILYDKFPKALEVGKERLLSYLDKELSVEKAAAARMKLIFTTSLAECVSNAELIIEAVPENVELKRQVWAEIDGMAPAGALICTNSSSLPCSRLADATSRPEKVFNINFSNPVHDNLVEVMRGATTADETLIAGVNFVRSLNMVPIVTYKEIMGFSFNRVWRAIKLEVLHLVDQGYSDFQDIDRAWMLEFGTPFGPFGLMDTIGLDVVRDIEQKYYEDSQDEKDKPPKMLEDMIIRGHLGVKRGRGFYKYPNPAYKEPYWLTKQELYQEDIEAKMEANKHEETNRD